MPQAYYYVLKSSVRKVKKTNTKKVMLRWLERWERIDGESRESEKKQAICDGRDSRG